MTRSEEKRAAIIAQQEARQRAAAEAAPPVDPARAKAMNLRPRRGRPPRARMYE